MNHKEHEGNRGQEGFVPFVFFVVK